MNMYFKFFLRNFFLLLIFLLGMSLSAVENGKKPEFSSTGYVQFDHVFWNGNKNDDFLSGAFLKSAGLSIESKFDNTWSCFVHLNFLNSRLQHSLSQAYIKCSGDSWSFKFGKLLIPFSLEETINSNHRIFLENCLLEGVVEDSLLGLTINFNTDLYNIFASVFIPELIYNSEKVYENKYSFSFRGFVNPFKYSDFVFHIGLNYKVIKKDPNEENSGESILFKDVPSFNAPYSLLVSHSSSLPKYYVVGYELAGLWKSLYIQGEYAFINASWRDYEYEIYETWYIQLSCFLTGESRVYDFTSGKFYDPNPRFPFGAFELAVRYSYSKMLNNGSLLTGVSVRDGEKDALVCGINWLVNSNLKFQINYAYEQFTYRLLNFRKISGFGFRVQFLY